MPRFYFPIVDAEGWIPDEQGAEIPFVQGAVEEARNRARSLASQALSEKKPIDGRRILVVDWQGRLVCEVPVKVMWKDVENR